MSIFDEVLTKRSLSPAARTATASGVSVDRVVNGGMQEAVVVISTGTITDGTHTFALEDSADGTTGWTAVPASALQGSMPAVGVADDDTVFEVGVRMTRQFLRVTVTVAGATVGGVHGAVIVLAEPRFVPVTRP